MVQFSVLQCVAECCSTLQNVRCIYISIGFMSLVREILQIGAEQCVAVCCSVLQCVAVCCSVLLQCIVVFCSILQCVAVCCRALQCVAGCQILFLYLRFFFFGAL